MRVNKKFESAILCGSPNFEQTLKYCVLIEVPFKEKIVLEQTLVGKEFWLELSIFLNRGLVYLTPPGSRFGGEFS